MWLLSSYFCFVFFFAIDWKIYPKNSDIGWPRIVKLIFDVLNCTDVKYVENVLKMWRNIEIVTQQSIHKKTYSPHHKSTTSMCDRCYVTFDWLAFNCLNLNLLLFVKKIILILNFSHSMDANLFNGHYIRRNFLFVQFVLIKIVEVA